MTEFARIALIGFGEVGRILGADLAARRVPEIAAAYDIAFADAGSAQSRAAAAAGVRMAKSASAAVKGAELIISAVTAAATLDAAKSVVPGLERGAYFLDLNSASPGMKRAASQAIGAAGGRYVEAAVMSPFPPKRIASPMLLGGPHARIFLDQAAYLGLNASVFSDEVGRASAVKMCRSILIKGMEALLTESMLTARTYGVEKEVLSSLHDLLPHPDWPIHACYMISRSLIHGKRRAEEMREAARTATEARVEPLMSTATAERQDWASEQREHIPVPAVTSANLGALLDAMIEVKAP